MTDAVFSACMKQMQAGDMDGLKSIYEAYLPMIYHGMLDVVRVKETAEDLAADFFVKLYNIRDSFKEVWTGKSGGGYGAFRKHGGIVRGAYGIGTGSSGKDGKGSRNRRL